MSALPRRQVLKAAAATAFGGLLASEAGAVSGVTRRADDGPTSFGGWLSDTEGDKHIPVVTSARRGDEVDVTIEVKHPQGAAHHVSNVRVYDAERIEVATADFHATLSTPRATMTLRVAAGTKLYAVSDCNKHGLWYLEFSV